MKKLTLAVCAAALALPVAAFAAPPAGQVAFYLSNTTLDVGVDDDGTGFGVRGWGMVNPNVFIHGEYQTVELDDFGIDVNSLRLGGGYAAEMSPGTMWMVKGEYVDFGSDLDQSGFGVHGGVVLGVGNPFSFFGSLGYLTTDDTDGLELNIGAHLAFNKQWGGVIDYRTYMGEADGGGDVDLSDLRIGVTYSF